MEILYMINIILYNFNHMELAFPPCICSIRFANKYVNFIGTTTPALLVNATLIC